MNCEKINQDSTKIELYRSCLQILQCRWKHEFGEDKLIDPKNAGTCYPNLVAEAAMCIYSFKELAEAANVSTEIILAVIQDREELTRGESTALSEFLNSGMDFLFGKSLQTVDPGTEDGRDDLEYLEKMADRLWRRYGIQLKGYPEFTIYKLQAGECVTYSEFSHAECALEDMLKTLEKKPPRQTRLERVTV